MTLLDSVHLPDPEVLSKEILQLIIVAMEGTQGENLIFLGQLWADRRSHQYFGDKLSAVDFTSCQQTKPQLSDCPALLQVQLGKFQVGLILHIDMS